MVGAHRWKVMIADDEAIIREGIRDAVDWANLNMEVVCEAEDGEEALEMGKAYEVDIALVDLNMPIMHGLRLIGHLRDNLPDCRIVIITGHDEFAYAQEAIRLGVQEYILKPASPGELAKVMMELGKQLDVAYKQSVHLRQASRQMARNITLFREKFGLEWMGGGLTGAEIMDQLEFLRLPLACPDWMGVIRWPEVTVNKPLLGEGERQLMLFAIENIAGEIIVADDKVIFRGHAGLIVVLIWGELAASIPQDIEAAVQAYLKLSVHTHFAMLDGNLAGVPAAYRECKSAVYKDSQISPVVRRLRQYVREEYHDPDLSLEGLAKLLQVSPVYLSRMVKQELGIPFVSLVTALRIEKAIQLLNSTDMPIHEIAGQVGYVTQHYFSTTFKKIVGVSPNQYRRGDAFSEQ
ncbi:response regulator [Paenibacillus sp. MAHUQ-46]|uniref:Response regulator n=2 Tax=Paenibacillus TaxID=44249 RepID=A0A934J540_9BACL|nr:response regulator [Paenibacillus roseus]